MHESETRALRRAALVLVAISALRWGWAQRPAPSSAAPEESVLPELMEASREAAVDEERRATPLGEGERIDPNRADDVELDRLPGVGPGTARAIVAAREAGAVFRTPEDLLDVPGIGPATLARVREALDLRSPPLPRPGRPGAGRTPSPSGPVDLNRADSEALQELPGIGPALAERILDARRERLFTSLEDLDRVSGIGPATIERLRGRAAVGGSP